MVAPALSLSLSLSLQNHANVALNALIPTLGCSHATELLNVWDIQPLLLAPGEQALANTFIRYWARFASSGSPNGGSDPVWAPYPGPDADSLAVLDISSGGGGAVNVTNVPGLRTHECDFWLSNNV